MFQIQGHESLTCVFTRTFIVNVDSLVLIIFGVLPLLLLQIVIENVDFFFLHGGKWRFWWELWQLKIKCRSSERSWWVLRGGSQVQKSKVKCKRWKQWWGTCDAWLRQKQFVIFQSKMCVCVWQRESYMFFCAK